MFRNRKGHLEGTIQVIRQSDGQLKIVFFEGMRTLGTVNGEQGEIEVKPELMGLGPVAIRHRAQFSEDPKDAVISKPITLTIVPGPELPPRKLACRDEAGRGTAIQI